MATYGPISVPYIFNLDSDWRSWAQSIQAVFLAGVTAGDLAQTADTGQVNLATVARPAANAVAGYEIYRFTDSAQATAPIYMKIEYGVSTTANTRAGIYLTVGTGSNGAGTITGILVNRFYIGLGGVAPNTSTGFTIGSTGPGRIWVHTGFDWAGGATTPLGFWVERVKDAAGAPSTAGFIVMCHTASVTTPTLHLCPTDARALAAIAKQNPGFPVVLPSYSDPKAGTDLAFSPFVLFFAGKPVYVLPLYGPTTADFAAGSTAVVPFLGANHTYVAIGPSISTMNPLFLPFE